MTVTLDVMFFAMANPSRLAILHYIMTHDGVCVTELEIALSEPLHIAQPTISHHLKKLRDAHLVAYTKDGLYNYYRATLPAALALLIREYHVEVPACR